MSKQIKSYSLSEEAVKEVERVRKERKYRSDSEALEAIILRKENDEEKIRRIVMEVLKENQLAVTANKPIEQKNDEVEAALIASIDDIFKKMD